MAISKTELCNKALTLVGANPIVNIDQDTENARVLNRVYELALRSILSECRWNFATRRKLLAQSAETLEWYHPNEAYIYVKPADCIRIFGTNNEDAEWREEGDLIISDRSGLGVKYVIYLDDPYRYPASFIEAFVDKLCSDIAYTIVNSATLGSMFFKKYQEESLPKATAENAQTGVNQFLRDDAWERSKDQDGSEYA